MASDSTWPSVSNLEQAFFLLNGNHLKMCWELRLGLWDWQSGRYWLKPCAVCSWVPHRPSLSSDLKDEYPRLREQPAQSSRVEMSSHVQGAFVKRGNKGTSLPGLLCRSVQPVRSLLHPASPINPKHDSLHLKEKDPMPPGASLPLLRWERHAGPPTPRNCPS